MCGADNADVDGGLDMSSCGVLFYPVTLEMITSQDLSNIKPCAKPTASNAIVMRPRVAHSALHKFVDSVRPCVFIFC